MSILNLDKINKLANICAFIFIFSSYFLWGLDNVLTQYLILLPIFFLFLKNPLIYFNKKTFYIILLPIFFLLHYICIILYNNLNLNFSNIIKIGYFFLICVFCLNFYFFFLNSLKKILIFFICLSLIILIFDILFKIYFFNLDNYKINLNQAYFCSAAVKSIFRNNLLFIEASHLSMINVAVCLSSIYYFSIEKKLLFKIFFIIYLCISLFSGATTFYVGFFLSSIAIFISCKKKLNIKFILVTIFFNIIILIFFFTDKSCLIRISDLKKNYQVQNNLFKNKNEKILSLNKNNEKILSLNKNNEQVLYFDKIYQETQVLYYELFELKQKQKQEDNYDLKLNELKIKILTNENILKELDNFLFETRNKNYSLNLTNQVHIRSFFIAKLSILDKFFGYGFENYKQAFENYRFDLPAIDPSILALNDYDASNNLSKLIVEFGFFSIIIFIFILIFSFNNKIEPELKIFLISIILTQFIRGAGYYNGGFLISIIFLILSNFIKKNTKVLGGRTLKMKFI